MAVGCILGFSIDLHRRRCNTVTLSCKCVIKPLDGWGGSGLHRRRCNTVTLSCKCVIKPLDGWDGSDAGTKLKVGNTCLVQKHFLSCPSTFLPQQVQFVILSVSFLLFYLWYPPPCPAICKIGWARAPLPCPVWSAPLLGPTLDHTWLSINPLSRGRGCQENPTH